MVVCICHNINDKSLKEIIKSNSINSVKRVHELDICNNCKKCCFEVKQIIKECNNETTISS